MRRARGWLRFHRCLDEPRKTSLPDSTTNSHCEPRRRSSVILVSTSCDSCSFIMSSIRPPTNGLRRIRWLSRSCAASWPRCSRKHFSDGLCPLAIVNSPPWAGRSSPRFIRINHPRTPDVEMFRSRPTRQDQCHWSSGPDWPRCAPKRSVPIRLWDRLATRLRKRPAN